MNNPSNEEIIQTDAGINISTFQSSQDLQQHRLYNIDIEWDDKKTIKNNSDDYYLILIKSYEKKERKKYLIEEELNDLDYDYYYNIEDRKYYLIFWSLFKNNYDFINAFLISNKQKYKQYKFYTIKIIIYINSIIISIILNILFLYNKRMHLLYQEEGNYNFIYNSPQIIFQDLVMIIFSKFFEYLIDYQEKFINIKNNLNNIRFQDLTKCDKILSIKVRYSFYIIILIINIFAYYYVTCFCIVYKSTQKQIIFDFLYGILLNLIFTIISCIVKTTIKMTFLKSEYNKCNKPIFNLLKSDWLYFSFEIILEIIVFLLYFRIKKIE